MLFGANVAEIHFDSIHMDQFFGSGFLLKGTSGRSIRTRAQIAASPTFPCDNRTSDPTVLTDYDGLVEIAWEDIPRYAQIDCPAIPKRALGPEGKAGRCSIDTHIRKSNVGQSFRPRSHATEHSSVNILAIKLSRWGRRADNYRVEHRI